MHETVASSGALDAGADAAWLPSASLSGSHGSASMQFVRAGLEHSTTGLAQQLLPDGVRRVRLQGRFLHLSVLDSQGNTACVDSPAALDRMLGSSR